MGRFAGPRAAPPRPRRHGERWAERRLRARYRLCQRCQSHGSDSGIALSDRQRLEGADGNASHAACRDRPPRSRCAGVAVRERPGTARPCHSPSTGRPHGRQSPARFCPPARARADHRVRLPGYDRAKGHRLSHHRRSGRPAVQQRLGVRRQRLDLAPRVRRLAVLLHGCAPGATAWFALPHADVLGGDGPVHRPRHVADGALRERLPDNRRPGVRSAVHHRHRREEPQHQHRRGRLAVRHRHRRGQRCGGRARTGGPERARAAPGRVAG